MIQSLRGVPGSPMRCQGFAAVMTTRSGKPGHDQKRPGNRGRLPAECREHGRRRSIISTLAEMSIQQLLSFIYPRSGSASFLPRRRVRGHSAVARRGQCACRRPPLCRGSTSAPYLRRSQSLLERAVDSRCRPMPMSATMQSTGDTSDPFDAIVLDGDGDSTPQADSEQVGRRPTSLARAQQCRHVDDRTRVLELQSVLKGRRQQFQARFGSALRACC